MTALQTMAVRLVRNARESMRDSAGEYRRARGRGDLAGMTKWLCFAALYRDLAAGYMEEVQ